MLGLMIHTLRVGNGKSCCSGHIPRFTDVGRSGAATVKTDWWWDTCAWHCRHTTFVILTGNESTRSRRGESAAFCFLRRIASSPNCWSVAADKTSDRYGSLSVCSESPRATADEDTQREVQVRANLFARPSISSFLIRIVEKSAAGGRLYGHHYPTSPYSLVLYSLVPQHMAALLRHPIWGVFQMAVPRRATSLLAAACRIVSEMKTNICIRRRCGV